ncbi:glycosyltransferase family 4 protein [Helicobacter sp. MIT 14-3879]|uniref:glycosyltransferase family 4 protein n=1 Tax=Helicobacter sp. MIT 14-3879 TaxID=2040649 RepID=UPI0015F17539|nr:glycosyltransferase family 4 protein [Helicobacter sp. MIT 14-3879]
MAKLCKNPTLSHKLGENQALKILHIASDSLKGGAESVFRDTIKLTSKYDRFIIYSASCDKEIKHSKHHILLDDYQNYNKIIGVIKYIFNFKNYFLLKNALYTLKPDVIHTQNYLSRLSPSILFALKNYKKKNPKVKLIYTQHGFGSCANLCFYNYNKNQICEKCKNANKYKIAFFNCDRRGRIYSIIKALRVPFYQGIFLKEQDLFDKIVFVSNFQMQKHIEEHYDKNKLVMIRNPINLEFYNENVKLEDKLDLIVFFGRISKEKNIPLLLHSFRELTQKDNFRNYKLLIIGDGDDKPRCLSLAKELLNKEQYQFINHLNIAELKDILRKAKLSVLPSFLYETFGLVIVESILSGCIPVVSNIGALKETQINFGGFSFNLKKGDLTQVLSKILNNYDKNFYDFLKIRKKVNINPEIYVNNLFKIYV